MRDEIYWVVTATLRPEDYEAFTEAITPLVAVTHVEDTFSRFAEDFGRLVSIEGFVVYGRPDEAAKKILDGFGSTYMTPFLGYTPSDAR